MAGNTTKDMLLQMLEEQPGSFVSGEVLANELSISRNAVWKAAQALRSQGYDIRAVTNRGYQLVRSGSAVLAEDVTRRLPKNAPLKVTVIPRVKSTNSEARRLAHNGAAEGTVVIANEQTAGRGRHDRPFFSPAGTGLYLSVVLRPSLEADNAQMLTTMGAVACALAIEELTGSKTAIKWVNDVFCRGKKVCGILTEAALDLESGGLQYAIVGMGVNLFPPAGGFPADLPQAGAVYTARPQGLESRSQLAGEILNQFFAFYPHLEEKPFFQAYRDRSLVLGREVTVLERGQTRTALALDLNPDFSLQVREADGRERALASGEVRVKL